MIVLSLDLFDSESSLTTGIHIYDRALSNRDRSIDSVGRVQTHIEDGKREGDASSEFISDNVRLNANRVDFDIHIIDFYHQSFTSNNVRVNSMLLGPCNLAEALAITTFTVSPPQLLEASVVANE